MRTSATDIPVPADYDSDGDADRVVFRGGGWHVAGQPTTFYGVPGVPGDYDEKAIYRPSTGQWFVRGGVPEVTTYGLAGDVPLALPHVIRQAFYSSPEPRTATPWRLPVG